MKTKTYVLKENELMYVNEVVQPDETNFSETSSFMRIENIGGKLYKSLLPEYFIAEKDAKVVLLSKNSNTLFASANTGDNILVQKRAKNEIVNIIDINKERDCSKLSSSEFTDYVYGLLQSHKLHKSNSENYWLRAFYENCERLHINPTRIMSLDPLDSFTNLFKYQSKDRENRLFLENLPENQ